MRNGFARPAVDNGGKDPAGCGLQQTRSGRIADGLGVMSWQEFREHDSIRGRGVL